MQIKDIMLYNKLTWYIENKIIVINYTMNNVHIMYIVQCTMYNAQCTITMCNVHMYNNVHIYSTIVYIYIVD